ncbi:MAG: Gfo/Idh/MocA family oxidoreductase [Brevefilum sp.]|nr:Gfo/Idh/MocA family oxidoreductase [Brevefilum sp.]
MDKFRWGILSTANIGRKAMIPALKKIPIAEVLAVASRDGERAKKFAEELEIPKPYGSYQALLEDPEIDAVYIPLPNHLHKEWTIRAAEAGKHILCEKPLALNASECEMMIAAANENGVILMESFMYRYHPRILAAVEMVRSGKIGSLKTIETGFTFYMHNRDDIRMKPEMGGGALMDVGCYCINISRLMAGRNPVAVQAQAVWAPTDVDEQLVGVLDFGEGLYAHFDCAFNQSSRQHCILAGTEGYLSIPEAFNPGEKRSVIQEVREGKTVQVHDFEGVDEYVLIAEHFMHTIKGADPIYPIDNSVANMRVIQALLDSARQTGSVVYL